MLRLHNIAQEELSIKMKGLWFHYLGSRTYLGHLDFTNYFGNFFDLTMQECYVVFDSFRELSVRVNVSASSRYTTRQEEEHLTCGHSVVPK